MLLEQMDSSPAVADTSSQDPKESLFSKYFKDVRIHTKIT